MKTINKIGITSLMALVLSGCGLGLFDKDNTPSPSPLTSFKPEAEVHTQWKVTTNSGSGKDHIKMVPAVTSTRIFTADVHGNVTATDKSNGKTLWKTYTGLFLTGGPAAGGDIVVAGSKDGRVVALSQADGQKRWEMDTSNEILAAPAVSNGVTLVKAVDGKVSAYANSDGHVLWNYQQVEPTLILRGSSAPVINSDAALIGFANGNLIKLTLQGGSLIWKKTVAIPQGSFPIERMVDIDANPLVLDTRVYAATYQGSINALELNSGKEIWTHEISSYTGIAADYKHAYVTDAKSHIWAFDANTGSVNWTQPQLEARNITSPAIMGNTIVVGDADGYLHWLSKDDGHFVARVRVNNTGIFATPVVSDNTLYVLTRDGNLAAYTIT